MLYKIYKLNIILKKMVVWVQTTKKDSNSNFTMNLTPFSAHITIKSSFIKCYSPPSTLSHPNPSAEYYLLVDENQELLEQIKELQERSQAFADTNKILEDKLSKSEEYARKRVGDRIEEIGNEEKGF